MMTGALASGEALSVPSPDEPLPLIGDLLRTLSAAGVRYCHWKSNAAIDRSASGDNDLDLLVGRSDLGAFGEALSHLGFVRAYKPGLEIPGIESFYGYDAFADRLVHVHAHYQLVVGDDRTKNYRLPIEDAYLGSAARTGLFALPSAEFEYVVFVIRMILKYCTWDEIAWCAVRRRRAGPSRTEGIEHEHLAAHTDEERVIAVVEEHLPFVGGELFAGCAAALEKDCSPVSRIRTGRRLERSLQPHARYSRRADRTLRIWRRFAIALERRIGGPQRNRFGGGGAMVGVMGGDGSGKSTALAALGEWLRPEFDVRLVHLGKPRWSATTFAVRAFLKGAALGAGALARVTRVSWSKRLSDRVDTYRPLFWLLCTARDRRNAYVIARRFATKGGLVLCDRYPHPRLSSMEAPLIASRTVGGPDNRLVRAMIEVEQRYHGSIAPPELLVVLRVDPEIAVQRKTEERPENVRARGAEVWNIDWRDSKAHVVDASQPEDAVARELKALVWSTLS
jgi:thymidylate kinase